MQYMGDQPQLIYLVPGYWLLAMGQDNAGIIIKRLGKFKSPMRKEKLLLRCRQTIKLIIVRNMHITAWNTKWSSARLATVCMRHCAPLGTSHPVVTEHDFETSCSLVKRFFSASKCCYFQHNCMRFKRKYKCSNPYDESKSEASRARVNWVSTKMDFSAPTT
jgi:hypothetical protein